MDIGSFRAFQITQKTGQHAADFTKLRIDELTDGEVIIKVHFSSVNYKDSMAALGKAQILRKSPLVGGIDLSGEVIISQDPNFREGQQILVTGCGLSELYDGGYAEYARVKADSIIPLPENLDLFKAMALGTAGFTVSLAMQSLIDNHQNPEDGPVLVTGATGGVGSYSVDILNKMGYEVVALTRKKEATAYLKDIGAHKVIYPDDLDINKRALNKTLWAGAIDNLGGDTLSWVLTNIKKNGNVVSIGRAQKENFSTTVMPFIIRGINLLGVTSANCDKLERQEAWKKLSNDYLPNHIETIASETIEFDDLPTHFQKMLNGCVIGRTVVKI
ncbi:MAG: acryloyl-CoA reductase [Pseudomonadota bacterium]